jgi:hypothetical protein
MSIDLDPLHVIAEQFDERQRFGRECHRLLELWILQHQCQVGNRLALLGALGPVPDWIVSSEETGLPDFDRLTIADLQEGHSRIKVKFGKSTSEPDSRDNYSTTLTNVSGERIRVLKFGGYSKTKNGFSLNTISSRFFTAEDFVDWYGQQGDWIEPGQSLTVHNNYGSRPCIWAYYCETEGGSKLIAGGVVT